MVDLRTIIAPSQTIDVTPPQRVLASGGAVANVVITIGKGGGGAPKSLAYSRSYSLSAYMEKQQKEVSNT